MKEYNTDLHFHSPYAGGVSKYMQIPVIAEQGKLKGLDIVASSDILHKDWLKHVKQQLVETENGVFTDREFGMNFILSTEVQTYKRVHHLIYFPDFASVETMRQKLKGKAQLDSAMCGRPYLHMDGEELAQKVEEVGGILGPAHAFTPYTAIYAHFDSIEDCYGGMTKEINFLELGLSADSYFADLIERHHKMNFLTCSDSHSPYPHRIGREFTRFKFNKPCFKELKEALEKRSSERITLNVGLDPREGKYHMTACNSCFTKYSKEQAVQLAWKCLKCKSDIKKGVRDRILELATFESETHPSFRPDYFHCIPLAEIIQIAYNVAGVNTQKVQGTWREFVEKFGNEIKILIDVPVVELSEVNEFVAKKIEAFRNGYVLYIPGGGGNYGKPIICDSEKELEKVKLERKNEIEGISEVTGQKTLREY